MFEQLFGSKTRVDLIKLFIDNPQRSFYVRELTREIGAQINSVRRELENLLNIGIIKMLNEPPAEATPAWEDKPAKGLNKKKFYQINESFILHDEFVALFGKAHLLAQKDLINKLSTLGNIYYLVLSGFFTGIEEAVTDILIVGNVSRSDLSELISTFEQKLDRDIKYTLMSLKEFKYRQDITDRFVYDILVNPKIIVVDKLDKKA